MPGTSRAQSDTNGFGRKVGGAEQQTVHSGKGPAPSALPKIVRPFPGMLRNSAYHAVDHLGDEKAQEQAAQKHGQKPPFFTIQRFELTQAILGSYRIG